MLVYKTIMKEIKKKRETCHEMLNVLATFESGICHLIHLQQMSNTLITAKNKKQTELS